MTHALIHAMAKNIAQQLHVLQPEAGWSYAPTYWENWQSNGTELTRHAAIKSADGREIHISRSTYPVKDRFTIDGAYPLNAKGEQIWLGHGTSQPSITVAQTKNAQQIAKEILRRFLPDYEAHRAKVQERVNQDNQHFDYVEHAKRLLTEVGCSFRDDFAQMEGGLPRDFPGYGRVQVNGSTVDLHLRSISPELAVSVLRLIQEQQKARRAA